MFLLTTRSGGLGLNRTGTDTVIIYDSDFNSTEDRQAENRCHRIDQSKHVNVISFITLDTVDERIFDISQRKTKRDEVLLDEE